MTYEIVVKLTDHYEVIYVEQDHKPTAEEIKAITEQYVNITVKPVKSLLPTIEDYIEQQIGE